MTDKTTRSDFDRWAMRMEIGGWLIIGFTIVCGWALTRIMWGMAHGYHAPGSLGQLLWGNLS